jgi:hypothetical protein
MKPCELMAPYASLIFVVTYEWSRNSTSMTMSLKAVFPEGSIGNLTLNHTRPQILASEGERL